MWKLAIPLLLAASPAAAQQSTCQWIYNQWVCNDTSPPRSRMDWGLSQPRPNSGPSVLDAFEAGRRDRAEADARADAERARMEALWAEERAKLAAQRKLREIQQHVAALIKDGKCEEAIEYALNAGEYFTAAAARQYCRGEPKGD